MESERQVHELTIPVSLQLQLTSDNTFMHSQKMQYNTKATRNK